MPRRPFTRRLALSTVGPLVVALAGTGCSVGDPALGSGRVSRTGPAATTSPATPSQPSPSGQGQGGSTTGPSGSGTTGAAELTVTVDDGHGGRRSWRLSCNPADGTVPDPAAACQTLARSGTRALATPERGQMCTQIYGGPQVATIAGTWRGSRVEARISRTDGCQLARWSSLLGVIPPNAMD